MAVMTALAITSAAFTVYGGIQADSEGRRQRRLAGSDAAEQARLKEIEVRKFAAEQELGFLSSGVVLEGSPLLVLKETKEQGLLDQQNILRAGAQRGDSYARAGRTAFFQSLGNAIGYGVKAYDSFNNAPKSYTDTAAAQAYSRGYSRTDYGRMAP